MKSLSRTDKEVLLKTVAQVLPISTMSVFLLPLGVCRVIEVLFNRFWWGCNLNGAWERHQMDAVEPVMQA